MNEMSQSGGMSTRAHQTMHASAEMQQCIQDCWDCHRVCLTSVKHCLQMGGRHAEPQHIGLLLDCAEICQTSANFMLRESPLHARTCATCAEMCGRCAADCDQFGDDEVMRNCAQMCRQCAESCRNMAQMAKA